MMEWVLFVDGASNSKGTGVRIVLISPKGEVMEYLLCFTFLGSNNTTEYEALIVGLNLAKKVRGSEAYCA